MYRSRRGFRFRVRAPRFLHRQALEARRMIRKLKSGGYRLYSRKKNPRTGRRRNLGTFKSRRAAEQHERAVQFFKRG
jgi:cell division septation protein DedD